MGKTGDAFRLMGASALVVLPVIARSHNDCETRRIAACQQEAPDVPHAHASEADRAVIERGPTSDIAPPPPERLPPGHAEFEFMPAPSTWRQAAMGNESQTQLVMRVAAGVRADASMKRRSPDNAYWIAPARDEYANAWGVSGATNRH